MNDPLHPTIKAYVDASNARDAQALTGCFAPDAVVRDEGQTHDGLVAISQWIAHTQAAFECTLEPRDVADEEGKTVVTNRLTGTFPGSPVDLRFFFRLQGDKIASLEIIP